MSDSTPEILACPVDVVCDAVGNVWIADRERRAVIGIDGRGEVIARIARRAGGDPFIEPRGLALAPDGNTLYVLDGGAGAIYRLDVTSWRASIEAPGEVPGADVMVEAVVDGLESPRAVAVDQEAGWLYLAMASDDRIRRVAVGDGGRAPDAVPLQGGSGQPEHMALSSDRRRLYVVESQPRSVHVVDLLQGEVSTLAALPEVVPELADDAALDVVRDAALGLAITVTPAGLVVADPMAGTLYGINPRHGTVVPMWRGRGVRITGGQAASPEMVRPSSVAFDRITRSYIVADPANHRLLRVSRDAQSTKVIPVRDPTRDPTQGSSAPG